MNQWIQKELIQKAKLETIVDLEEQIDMTGHELRSTEMAIAEMEDHIAHLASKIRAEEDRVDRCAGKRKGLESKLTRLRDSLVRIESIKFSESF